MLQRYGRKKTGASEAGNSNGWVAPALPPASSISPPPSALPAVPPPLPERISWQIIRKWTGGKHGRSVLAVDLIWTFSIVFVMLGLGLVFVVFLMRRIPTLDPMTLKPMPVAPSYVGSCAIGIGVVLMAESILAMLFAVFSRKVLRRVLSFAFIAGSVGEVMIAVWMFAVGASSSRLPASQRLVAKGAGWMALLWSALGLLLVLLMAFVEVRRTGQDGSDMRQIPIIPSQGLPGALMFNDSIIVGRTDPTGDPSVRADRDASQAWGEM